MVGHVRGSVDFATPKSMRGPGHPLQRLDKFYNWEPRQLRVMVCRLTNRGPIFEATPHGFEGNIDMGLVRSPFITGRGFTTLNAVSSKKHGQVLRTDDLDDVDSVSTEQELHSQPVGFGHGKIYDTSLEDKLLEEINRDKTAQAAALSRKKNNAGSKDDSKKLDKRTTLEHPSTTVGVKVWVGDLPKKKNIERDLRSAFGHVSGLLEISPSLVGNEKTRDPICKGFGYLIFDKIDHAKSFISSFQGEPIRFGKIEKRVSYRILTADNADAVSSGKESPIKLPRLRVRDKTAASKVAAPVSYVSTPNLKPELASSGTPNTDILMDDMEERESTLPLQQSDLLDKDIAGFDVEVVQNTEDASLSQEYDESSEEEDDDDDDNFELGNEVDFEISCFIEGGNSMVASGGIGLHHDDNTVPMDEPGEIEGQHVSEDEKRIDDLEKRLRKKLEDAGFESQKSMPKEQEIKPRGTISEEQVPKPRGFKSRKSQASKRRTVRNGNSLGSVTNRLKKKEREFMTGVFERYGRSPSNAKS